MFFSIVIATHNRKELLIQCFKTIQQQTYSDYEVIVAHTGYDDGTEEFVRSLEAERAVYLKCVGKGAAIQRNEGVALTKGSWVVFLDDDVELEKDFLDYIHQTIEAYPTVKGVSGAIINQYTSSFSRFSEMLLKVCGVKNIDQIGGTVQGPVLNFLPFKEGDNIESIQWMPTCVCAYEKQLFVDNGMFPKEFVGYSYGEDLYVSLKVSKEHLVLLNRSARLYHHDIGSTSHKDYYTIAKMQVENRNLINRDLMGDNTLVFNLRLWVYHNILLFNSLVRRNVSWKDFGNSFLGYNLTLLKCVFR